MHAIQYSNWWFALACHMHSIHSIDMQQHAAWLLTINAGPFPANRYTSYMTSSTSVDLSLVHRELVILGEACLHALGTVLACMHEQHVRGLRRAMSCWHVPCWGMSMLACWRLRACCALPTPGYGSDCLCPVCLCAHQQARSMLVR